MDSLCGYAGCLVWVTGPATQLIPALLLHLRERRDPQQSVPRRQPVIAVAIPGCTAILLIVQNTGLNA